MNKRFVLLFLIFLLVFLPGCIDQNSGLINVKQAKFENSKDYPSSKYLTAIGIAESKESARSEAKSELANIFESEIESQFKINTKAIVSSVNGEHINNRIDSTINVYSKVKLKGVQVPKIWYENDKYHALAILDKARSKSIWIDEIIRLNQMMETEYKNLQLIKGNILLIKPLQRIWNLWMERLAVTSRLNVIGFSAPKPGFDIKDIYSKISKVKNEMRIYLNISGEYSKNLYDSISKNLNNEGFIIVNSKSKADVYISGFITTEPDNIQNKDWKFSRAKLSLQIIDMNTGFQAGDIAETKRVGLLTYKKAEINAVKKVSTIASEKIILLLDPFYF